MVFHTFLKFLPIGHNLKARVERTSPSDPQTSVKCAFNLIHTNVDARRCLLAPGFSLAWGQRRSS